MSMLVLTLRLVTSTDLFAIRVIMSIFIASSYLDCELSSADLDH